MSNGNRPQGSLPLVSSRAVGEEGLLRCHKQQTESVQKKRVGISGKVREVQRRVTCDKVLIRPFATDHRQKGNFRL